MRVFVLKGCEKNDKIRTFMENHEREKYYTI